MPADSTLQVAVSGFCSAVTLAGVDYLFYSYPDVDGIHQDFAYLNSVGIGNPWSLHTLVGQFDASGTAAISSSVQAAAFSTSWAITMGLSPGAGTTEGQGYFESALAVCTSGIVFTAVAVSQSFLITVNVLVPTVSQPLFITVAGDVVTVHPRSLGATTLTTWGELLAALNADPQVTALFTSALIPGTNPGVTISEGTVIFSAGAFSTVLPTKERISNNAKTLFLCEGVGLRVESNLQVRVKWPNGRFLAQNLSGDQTVSGSCFPQGVAGNMIALNEPVPIERGAVIAVEIAGTGVGNVDLQFWGKLRYLLKDSAGGGVVDEETCVVGYPAAAQGNKTSCLVGYPVKAGAGAGFSFESISDPVAALEDLPRFGCGPNQNVMAPEFRMGNQATPETPTGFEDESFTFLSPAYTVAVGQSLYGCIVTVPGAVDVVIKRFRLISTWDDAALAVGPPVVIVGLQLPSGYSVTGGDLIPTDLLWWAPLFPTLRVAHGARIVFDLSSIGFSSARGSITTRIEFDAVKRRRVS